MTPRKTFERALEDLRVSLEEMGQCVENAYERMFRAVEEHDEQMIRSIMRDDRIVGDLEKSIEAQCLSLITRQQPVARDLRFISATLKIVTDLERVGDHVADIGELTLRFEDRDIFRYSPHLEAMVGAAKEQIHAALACFLDRDMETARAVIEGDDLIDDLFNQVKDDIIRFLKSGAYPADDCVDVLMIAKYLEKIGDHANNIAQWECFQETGNIRNTRLL